MHYRRARVKGGTYFFTIVTYGRAGFLCEPEHVRLLRESFKTVMERHPYRIDAFVLLPDHLHCIWTLPENDCDYSMRWRLVKSHFSRRCNKINMRQTISQSRKSKKEQAVWQRRYWEHLIQNGEDLIRHVEYIHYNPVKHNLAVSPKDWQFSSFHRYVKKGLYHQDWAAGEAMYFDESMEFE